MSKIKTKVSKEANFIYHMLSVAHCGYDNDYGKAFAHFHPAEDLQILKKHELHITVKGGEHCGQLYWPLIAIPASLDYPANDYYTNLLQIIESNNANAAGLPNIDNLDIEGLLERIQPHAAEALEICKVMEQNYNTYVEKVWKITKTELETYAQGFAKISQDSKITDKLENIVGEELDGDFYASFVNSIADGPEAIDISKNQDIFGIGRSCDDALRFVSHEFVIYLLKQALAEVYALADPANWLYTESLAAFYLELAGIDFCFLDNRDVINQYRAEYERSKLSAVELYKAVRNK